MSTVRSFSEFDSVTFKPRSRGRAIAPAPEQEDGESFTALNTTRIALHWLALCDDERLPVPGAAGVASARAAHARRGA